MEIVVKRVYELFSKDDGCRVLVDRMWPRGMTKERARIDLWAKDLAPTTDLRRWFGHDPAKWESFCIQYKAELKQNSSVLAALRNELSGKRKVTLLYAAKDTEHNQAIVLRDILAAEESRLAG